MAAVGTTKVAEFARLEPYRRELTAHCYRMLASPQDAEDAVQDTFLHAWNGLAHFQDRAGLRPWLYRIATNVCLDMLRGRGRRALPIDVAPAAKGRSYAGGHDLVLGTARPETTWVQPLPDSFISSVEFDPADVVVSRESVRLAFIAALQHLVPRQRAVLVLRDVLHWKAEEVAELLETSVDAVNSTVRRARAVLAAARLDLAPSGAGEADRELLARYIDAFERYDVEALVALLHEDATLSMPPFELWLRGVTDIRNFLMAMADEAGRDYIVPLEANRCPALAVYRPNASSGHLEPFGIHVLDVVDGRIAAVHAFLDPGLFSVFGLPLTPEGALRA